MKLKTSLLAAAATLALAPAANAEGLYGAIGAGLSYFGYENEVENLAGPGTTFSSNADYDNGIGVYAALGYDWGALRTELEYSYRSADIDQIDPRTGFSGITSGQIAGDTTIHSIMANMIYDFDFGGRLTPYLGGGIGFGLLDHDIAGTNPAGAPVSPLSIAYGPSTTKLAYQGIAGVAVNLADNLILDLSYRYHDTLTDGATAVINGVSTQIEADTHSHNLFAGLRWNFGAAPAPAPQYKDCWDGSSVPVAAECPPQVIEQQAATPDPIAFTVYFDYDKSNLTPQAATLVQEAASRALQNDIDTVVVSGNTDTSGSSAYNQALSERRARVVREALIANGVSADAIRTEAYGETNLAKSTADGVREPLNRRSEVTISFE